MPDHPVKLLIEAADRAISANDLDSVMEFYTDDAILVVKPGLIVAGKERIRRAFSAIADYFHHRLSVRQGKTVLLESGDTVLVIMESLLDTVNEQGAPQTIRRKATYVFRRDGAGKWLCAIDNSYGTDLLDED